jgi:predicted DNA-binding transcriptional regulator YafY
VSDTTTRALDLLSLLQSHRHWSSRELAARLGVTDRTLRRDIDRLRELGYEIDAARGAAATGWSRAPGCRPCCSPTMRAWP